MPILLRLGGRTFTLPSRYAPGHCLSPGEAQAMNTLLRRMVRKNRGPQAERMEHGEAQAMLAAYAEAFTWQLNPEESASPDPTQLRAWELAEAEARAAGFSDDNARIAEIAARGDIQSRAAAIAQIEAEAARRAMEELMGGRGGLCL